MDVQTAVRTCFRIYTDFHGRATRPEYWWFVLFLLLVHFVLGLADGLIFGFDEDDPSLFGPLFALATFLPSLAVGARRLHDIDLSGWWLLIVLAPLVGSIVLIVWFILKSQPGDNAFGPDPHANTI